MKQVIARAGKVEVIDVPVPSISDNEVLVKTAYSVISSGTELWTIQSTEPISADDLLGDKSKLKKAFELSKNVLDQEGLTGLIDYYSYVKNPQVPLGYSLSGTVVKIGRNVTDVAIGERVACAGEGKAIHADYAAVPRNLLVKVPEKISFKDAAFASIGAIALHAFRTSGAQIGEYIGIIGAGLIGNLVIQVAKASGCNVMVIDQREDRLQLAKECGADLTILNSDEMLLNKALAFSSGRGLDRVLICAASDSNEPVNLAAKLLRDRGVVTIVGRVRMDFERKYYYQKELEIRMSRSLGPGRYDPLYEDKSVDYPIGYVRWTLNRNMEAFLNLIASDRVNVSKLIASIFPIEHAAEAYSSLRESGRVAVLLQCNDNNGQLNMATSVIYEYRKAEGAINVALIGPGNFAKEIMIPALRRNRRFNLYWVVASNQLNAKLAAERYHFERFGTDYKEAIHDERVDLVMITAPNYLHYPITVEAMKAGKPVFVEKPLCIKEEELEEIVKLQGQTKAPVIVGFNRRYSQLTAKLKSKMNALQGPFIMQYRINADYIPYSRWVQDPNLGGGRVIAECCHFIDFFNFLLDSYNPELSVTSVAINGSTTIARDNVIITLRYRNGSVATILYSSLGNRNLERERVEVFGDGVAMVLEDFRRLSIHTKENVTNYSLKHIDKGHAEELEELAKLVRGESNHLIKFEEAVASTRLTFLADKMLRNSII